MTISRCLKYFRQYQRVSRRECKNNINVGWMQPTGLHEHLAHVSWDVGCFKAFWFLFKRDQVEELKQEIHLIEKFILIKKIY